MLTLNFSLIRNQYICEYLARFFLLSSLIPITLSRRAMAHDEKKYQDPHAFKPERFLDADGKLNDDDRILTYGFGRRLVLCFFGPRIRAID